MHIWYAYARLRMVCRVLHVHNFFQENECDKRAESSTVHNYTVEARQDRVLCMGMGKEEHRNVRRPATGLNEFISRLIASPNTNPPQVKVLFLLLVNGISKSTAQRNTQVVKCGLPVDFGFLWDESGSIGAANFRTTLDFAAQLVDSFELGPSAAQARVGVVVFSTTPRITVTFADSVAGNAFTKNAILRTDYRQGSTNLAEGLDMLRTQLMAVPNGMRPAAMGVPRVAIVVTDGKANTGLGIGGGGFFGGLSGLFGGGGRGMSLYDEATKLKADGVVVIAVGVKGYDLAQLTTLATKPSLVFEITDFNAMMESVRLISQAMCTSTKEYTTTTTTTTIIAATTRRPRTPPTTTTTASTTTTSRTSKTTTTTTTSTTSTTISTTTISTTTTTISPATTTSSGDDDDEDPDLTVCTPSQQQKCKGNTCAPAANHASGVKCTDPNDPTLEVCTAGQQQNCGARPCTMKDGNPSSCATLPDFSMCTAAQQKKCVPGLACTVTSAGNVQCDNDPPRAMLEFFVCPIVDSACGEGTCTSSAAAGTGCVCPEGFTGFGCSTKCGLEFGNEACPDPCDPNPCFNGGTCIPTERDGLADFVCSCPSTPAGLDPATRCGPPSPRIVADPKDVPANATLGTIVGGFEAFNAAPGVLAYSVRDVQPSASRRLRRGGPARMPEFSVDSTTGVLRTASDLGEFGGSSFDVVVTARLRYGLSSAESQPAAMRVAVTPVTDASLALGETVNPGGCGGGCVAGVLVGLLLLLLLLVVLWWLCFKNEEDDDNEDDGSVSMKANPTHYANQAFNEPTTATNTARHEAGLGLVRANVAGGAVSNGARNTPRSNVIYSSANDTSLYLMPMEGGSGEVIYDQAAGKVLRQQGGEGSALRARAAQGDAAPSVYAVPLEGGGSVEVYSLAGVNGSGAVAVFPAALYDVAGNVVVQEATTVYDQAGNAYISGSDAPVYNEASVYAVPLEGGGSVEVYSLAGVNGSGAVAVFPAALYDVAGNVVVQETKAVYDQAGNAYSSSNDTPAYAVPLESGGGAAIYAHASSKVARPAEGVILYDHAGNDRAASVLYDHAGNDRAASVLYDQANNERADSVLYDQASNEHAQLYDVAASGGAASSPLCGEQVYSAAVSNGGPAVYDAASQLAGDAGFEPAAAVYDVGNNNSTMPVYDLSTNLNTPVYAMAGAESSTDTVQCTRMGPKRMCTKPAVDGTLFCTGHTCPFPACNEGKSSKATCCSAHDGAEMPTSASPHGAGAPPIQRGASGRQSGTYGFGGDASSDERGGGGGGITRNGRHHASVYDGFGPAEDNAEGDC